MSVMCVEVQTKNRMADRNSLRRTTSSGSGKLDIRQMIRTARSSEISTLKSGTIDCDFVIDDTVCATVTS